MVGYISPVVEGKAGLQVSLSLSSVTLSPRNFSLFYATEKKIKRGKYDHRTGGFVLAPSPTNNPGGKKKEKEIETSTLF